MRRNVLTFIGVAIVVVILGLFGFYSCDGQKGGQRSSVSNQVGKDPCAEAVQIAKLEAEVARLNTELAVANAKLIDCLESQIPASKTSTVKAPVTKAAAPTPKVTTPPKSTPVPVAKTPVGPTTGTLKSGTPGIANLDYLRQDGDILFCVRVNGEDDCYFPHYAMDRGVMFSQAPTNNQVKGYNWKVEPTELFEGDYGVTIDGTYYVSDELIQKSLQAGTRPFKEQVEIKCPYTGWSLKTMTKSGNYWVFATQR